MCVCFDSAVRLLSSSVLLSSPLGFWCHSSSQLASSSKRKVHWCVFSILVFTVVSERISIRRNLQHRKFFWYFGPEDGAIFFPKRIVQKVLKAMYVKMVFVEVLRAVWFWNILGGDFFQWEILNYGDPSSKWRMECFDWMVVFNCHYFIRENRRREALKSVFCFSLPASHLSQC